MEIAVASAASYGFARRPAPLRIGPLGMVNGPAQLRRILRAARAGVEILASVERAGFDRGETLRTSTGWATHGWAQFTPGRKGVNTYVRVGVNTHVAPVG